jgi:triphosphatase
LSNHTETELKLSCADETVWEQIMTAVALTTVAVPGSEITQQLEARYFDTPSHALQKAKLAYRVRREGENWVATVKDSGSSKGGLHARQEWNQVVSHNEPDIQVFSAMEIGPILQEIIGDENLEPILITSFERRKVDVVMSDGSTVEVAADKGAIIAGEKTDPILEIELELKTGQAGALFILGAALAQEFPLLPEPKSKFYRGLLLAGLSAERPKKNHLPQVGKAKPVGEALRDVLVELVMQVFTAQQTFLENFQQPGVVHELWVALCRLQSVLTFSEPLAVIKRYTVYQDELGKWGRTIDDLQELDVIYASWQQLLDHQIVAIDSKVWLGEVLLEKRNQAAVKIVAECRSGLATPLLLGLWAELLDRDWQQLISCDSTVEEYAVGTIADWLKMVRKQEKTATWTDADEVDRLRLWTKKLMYTVEVMQPVLGGTSRMMLQLEKLQRTLGVMSDAHRTTLLLKELLREKSSRALHLEAGILLGWQGHERLLLQEKLDKSWKKFNRAVQKWK